MIGWVVFLFLLGMVLILAELFVPGLICGIIGLVLVVASCVIGVIYYPDYWIVIVVVEAVGSAVFIIGGLYIIPRTGVGKTLILDKSQEHETGWVSTESDTSLIGGVGTVYTALRPAGSIMLNNKRIDAVSDGAFIDKDKQVRVIEVHGNRVVVEETGHE